MIPTRKLMSYVVVIALTLSNHSILNLVYLQNHSTTLFHCSLKSQTVHSPKDINIDMKY